MAMVANQLQDLLGGMPVSSLMGNAVASAKSIDQNSMGAMAKAIMSSLSPKLLGSGVGGAIAGGLGGMTSPEGPPGPMMAAPGALGAGMVAGGLGAGLGAGSVKAPQGSGLGAIFGGLGGANLGKTPKSNLWKEFLAGLNKPAPAPPGAGAIIGGAGPAMPWLDRGHVAPLDGEMAGSAIGGSLAGGIDGSPMLSLMRRYLGR